MSSTFEHLDIEFEEINKLGIAEIIALKGEGGVLSEQVKQTLLECFRNVAWVDEHGQEYVDALRNALYPPAYLVSISAIYTQSGTIYPTDSLDDLKDDLVVTATYSDGVEVVAPTYALSGELTVGESIITVSYGGKITTFTVEVTRVPNTYDITNNLTGASNSNSATYVTEGNSYSATITANESHTLDGATISITMGGVDITSTAYDDGAISIDEVTGDLIINVTAVAIVLESISAVYTQKWVVYDNSSLDDLKNDLVVTALYNDESSEIITNYTLSGTLEEGTSTITVLYGDASTTFDVTVTNYMQGTRLFTNSGIGKQQTGGTITNEGTTKFYLSSTATASFNLFAYINSNAPTYGNLEGHTLRFIMYSEYTPPSTNNGSLDLAVDASTTVNSTTRGKYGSISGMANANYPKRCRVVDKVLDSNFLTSGSVTPTSGSYVRFRIYLYANSGASGSVRLEVYDLGVLS